MAKSATFSVLKASAHSSAHNSRDDIPDYLIGFKDGKKNSYDLRHSDNDFLELAKVKYQEVTGQKMQQKQIDALIKETVLSLEDHHSEVDVQKVFDTLNEKYGGHYITELSIHKDEGHFEDKNGITYYPTKDILQKEDGWYIVPLDQSLEMKPSYKPKEYEFSEKVDINDFKPIHNIHAHVKFSMFDLETGKTGRMKHNELNDRIKTAAKVLGLDYNPEKGIKKRTPVEQIKTQHKAVRNEKIKVLEKGLTVEKSLDLHKISNQALSADVQALQKERKTLKEELQALKAEKAKERVELQTKDAIRSDYAQMEAKYKAMEAEIRERSKPQGEIIETIYQQNDEAMIRIFNSKAEIIEVKDGWVGSKKVEVVTVAKFNEALQQIQENNRKMLKKLSENIPKIVDTKQIEALEKELSNERRKNFELSFELNQIKEKVTEVWKNIKEHFKFEGSRLQSEMGNLLDFSKKDPKELEAQKSKGIER